MSATISALPEGTVLNSGIASYSIIKVLGSGGFGITYLAETIVQAGNSSHTLHVAIKECYSSQLCWRENDGTSVGYSQSVAGQLEQSKKDFISEAKRLKAVGNSHPNIVKVHEVFEANNTAYYVMEYLQGESLYTYVQNTAGVGGGLSEGEMWRLMKPIIETISFLHENRITHLDIKPDNIMIVKCKNGDTAPVLIDFGLSKHYDKDGRPTSTINTLGITPGYSPIEQYGGIREFSPASDIYALTATILYCLSGHDPKESNKITPEDIDQMLPKDGCSALFRGTIHKCMSPFAKDRPSDVGLLRIAYSLYAGECYQVDEIDNLEYESMNAKTTAQTIPFKEPLRPASNPLGPTIPITGANIYQEVPEVDFDAKRKRATKIVWLCFAAFFVFIFICGGIKHLYDLYFYTSTVHLDMDGKYLTVIHKGKPSAISNVKYGLRNIGDKTIFPTEYDYIGQISDKLLLVKKDGQAGLSDTSGKFIIPLEYRDIDIASWGYFWLKGTNNLIGLTDSIGQIIYTPKFEKISNILNGQFTFENDKKIGVASVSGKIIIPNIYDKVTIENADQPPSRRWFKVTRNRLTSFINPSDIREPEERLWFKNVERLKYSGGYIVKGDTGFGIVNDAGKIVLPLDFNEIKNDSTWMVRVLSDSGWGYVNTTDINTTDHLTVDIPGRYAYADPFSTRNLQNRVTGATRPFYCAIVYPNSLTSGDIIDSKGNTLDTYR